MIRFGTFFKLSATLGGAYLFLNFYIKRPCSQVKSAMTDSADAGELSRPLVRKGRFDNPWDTWRKFNLFNAARFQFWEKDNSNIPNEEVLNETLPVETPDFSQFDKKSPISGIRTLWIGHASVLVQFDGITILTDPVFSDRCFPSQYVGPKRYRKPACRVEDLPKVDVVIISHNHYDHLDYWSVLQLQKRFGDSLTWYVPKGLRAWFLFKGCFMVSLLSWLFSWLFPKPLRNFIRCCVPEFLQNFWKKYVVDPFRNWYPSTGCKNVVELDWWEETEHSSGVKFACTPCQHWSKRGAFDDNKTLWCSWAVIGPKHRFFFGGDTGYCKTFKEIGQKYGPFTMATIPIGAYEPRWFMHPQHVNPEESVKIHQDVRSKKSLGIHWGTFKLTYEPYLEPREKLAAELEKKNLGPDEFITLNHGRVTVLGGNAYESVD